MDSVRAQARRADRDLGVEGEAYLLSTEAGGEGAVNLAGAKASRRPAAVAVADAAETTPVGPRSSWASEGASAARLLAAGSREAAPSEEQARRGGEACHVVLGSMKYEAIFLKSGLEAWSPRF
ncbi:hypothetical protein OsJ_26499 [Oryza sativa Japonica Group]|uniref:Uncharacterized protein n=1 Tax=Oryza sativa subsp. japonica TaxID=39947 RepID=B9FZQ3_ORYSJ|nr:hypothetical protein OsJ_26499 [Oryza sativa Japonica Group]